MKGLNQYQKAAVIGMFLMGATMEEICAASGLYWKIIKEIIDVYKKETGSDTPHSTTTGNSFTCTTTQNNMSSTV